ncbi:hypothetical protein A1Q2_06188 [Trichosporon asahii var. asahii CBS 8904]|uniref:Uncharacterized protein n=2 Tax=Trichosporon asahii var. asahii TaxID=189963 RepID=K1VFC7_TRIAC|nr:hypothetical protein A1Q1_02957 [Trichosporon asahii var. asahii CBS 2479]EJT48041.1 hypothetical protein A1Q1_02957 [Trichosporon asahii var. asahii CBS 2479]EKC99525.1 hypothetical protein A1Q2_06188 [Trichosporon asahii var. asahii CBS 8904]
MVAPPASNEREYKASARADGGWVRGRIVRRKREDSLRKTTSLRDQYGHTKEGAVLKTLRFSKLVDAPPSEHLGCIDVYLEAGTAYLSNKPRGAVNGNTPTAAVDEKMKKYATRDSILAQNSIADHHRAISRANSSKEHKPINPRHKRSTVEVAAPAEGSRKKARSTNMDTKPRVIDLSNAGNPSTVISLLDSDDEL